MNNFKEAVTFLNQIGFNQSKLYNRTHAGHLGATYHFLSEWGLDEEVCIAGLLHSVVDPESGYDNEPVDLDSLPPALAPERVKRLIAGYYLLERTKSDDELIPTTVHLGPHSLSLSRSDLADIADIAIADRIDQVDWCWKKHYIAPTPDVLAFLRSGERWTKMASEKPREAIKTLLLEVENSAGKHLSEVQVSVPAPKRSE